MNTITVHAQRGKLIKGGPLARVVRAAEINKLCKWSGAYKDAEAVSRYSSNLTRAHVLCTWIKAASLGSPTA